MFGNDALIVRKIPLLLSSHALPSLGRDSNTQGAQRTKFNTYRCCDRLAVVSPTDPNNEPEIVLTDAADAVADPSWWATAKRWIRTPGALYLTTLLLIVTGTQAWVAWKQWKTMQGELTSMNNALPSYRISADAAKKSADTAHSSLVLSQETFKVQQRPYVWVKTPTIEPDGLSPNKPIYMNIEFANAGATPALQMVSHVYVKFSEVADSDFDAAKYLYKQPGVEKSGIITQNSTLFATAVSAKPVTLWTKKPIPWNGSDPIFVYGRIEYRDVFGDDHSTEFCWHYLLPNQVFMTCAKHNDIDLPKIDFPNN
jgi:hypothetical protein